MSEISVALEQAWCHLSVFTPTTLYPLARTPGFTSPEQMLTHHSSPIHVHIIKNSHMHLPRIKRSPEEERTQCPLLKRDQLSTQGTVREQDNALLLTACAFEGTVPGLSYSVLKIWGVQWFSWLASQSPRGLVFCISGS